MSRSERYNARDLTYSAAHRIALPEFYERIGHRADACDRDWTEFCHFCREPLGIYEEVRDRGQDLRDKATTVTVRLAQRAQIPAGLIAWRTGRPDHIQERMDQLHAELRALEGLYPITGFTVRPLYPERGGFSDLTPERHWQQVALLHAEHEAHCWKVPLLERSRLLAQRERSLIRLELFSLAEMQRGPPALPHGSPHPNHPKNRGDSSRPVRHISFAYEFKRHT